MSFYQNLFDQEFRGSWPLGDRQYSITFRVPPNKNKSDYQLAWNSEPYDLSVVNTLTINYAWDVDFKNYSALAINIAGVAPATTLASEVVAKLNADATFASMFTAQVYFPGPLNLLVRANTVLILPKSGRPKSQIRVWISNSGAERKLGFNRQAGVAELPTYYERETINNRFNYPDAQGLLIHLDETDPTIDQPIITNAGFNPAAMQADWQLLRGRSGLFNFQKITVDGSDRITQIIEAPAGALAGDFARKITYSYTGANKNPDKICEIPYTLTTGDLVTP